MCIYTLSFFIYGTTAFSSFSHSQVTPNAPTGGAYWATHTQIRWEQDLLFLGASKNIFCFCCF